MVCKVEFVKAPNGEASILYQSLMQKVKSQKKALSLYLHSKTESYKEWKKVNKLKDIDKNGEELLKNVLRYVADPKVRYKPEAISLTVKNAKVLLRKLIPNITEKEYQFIDALVLRKLSGKEDLLGFYHKGILSFKLNEDSTVDTYVLRHEVMHKIYNEFLTVSEQKRLEKSLKKEFPELIGKSQEDIEEHLSDLYMKHAEGLYSSKRNVIQRFLDFLSKLFNTYNANYNSLERFFEAVESGTFNYKYRNQSNGYVTRAMVNIKKTFKTAKNYKDAIDAILDKVYIYKNEGDNSYPMTFKEMYVKIHKSLLEEFHMTTKALKAEALKEGTTEEEKAQILEAFKKTDAKYDKLFQILSNYKGLWKDIFPTWSLENMREETIEEIEDRIHNFENPDDEATVGISEHLDKDLFDSEKGLSDTIKMALGTVKSRNGEFLNWRFVFVKMLQLLEGVDTSSPYIREQLDENFAKLFKTTVKNLGKFRKYNTYRVLEFLEQLLTVTEFGSVIENFISIPEHVRFLHNAETAEIDHFIIAKEGKNAENIKSKKQAKNEGTIIIDRNGRDTKEFVNEIIEATGLNVMQVRAIFDKETSRNLLAEVVTAMGSLYKKNSNITIVDKTKGIEVTSIDSKSVTVQRATKSTMLRNLIKNLDTVEKIEKLELEIAKLFKKNTYTPDKQVRVFFHILKMDSYAKAIDPEDFDLGTLAEDIKFFGIRLSALAKEMKYNADMDVEAYIKGDANNLLNKAAQLLSKEDELSRATSAKSADGKTRYLWNPGHWASYVIDKLNKSQHNVKPEFLKLEFFKNNPIVAGLNKIYRLIYSDGIQNISWNDDIFPIAYNKEKFNDFITRNFLGGFLAQIKASNKESIKYIQYAFTPSDRPNVHGAEMNVLNKQQALKTIKQILIQFKSRPKQFVLNGEGTYVQDIVGYDPEKVTHFKILWDAYKQLHPEKAIITKDGSYAILGLQDIEITKELIDLVYDQFKVMSKELTTRIVREEIELDENTHLIKNVGDTLKSLVDTELFKDWSPQKLTTKDIGSDRKVVSKSTWKDMGMSKQEADEKGITRDYLIEEEALEPLVHAFIVNNYLNGYAFNQLLAGDFAFQGNGVKSVKRFAGIFSSGLAGLIGRFGASPKFRMGVMRDIVSVKGKPGDPKSGKIAELLHTLLPDEEISTAMDNFADSYEMSDGQGFMLEERADEITYSYGVHYKAGQIFKPVIFFIDEFGISRFVKYSAVVLTEELCERYPELKNMRDNMRKAKLGELVFNTAVKVGNPKVTSDSDLMLTEGYSIPQESTFEVDVRNYRLQFNPMHKYGKNMVTFPSQMLHFINILKVNTIAAKRVYSAHANLLRNSFNEQKRFISRIGINNYIAHKLKKQEDSPLREFLENGIKINFPAITDKATIQLGAALSKSIVEVKFSGGKLVLQSAYGIKKYRSNIDSKGLLERELKYKVKKDADGKETVMYAEAILPKGFLDADSERIIQHAVDNGLPIPDIFVTPDLFGFRLPSSELHSAIPLKVVGFYDSKGSNIIVVPEQVVPLHGSDYDVDSLFVLKREHLKGESTPYGYFKNNNGLLEFDYKKNTNKMNYDQREAYWKNTIVETLLTVVSEEKNRSRMTTPINMNPLHKQVKRIEQQTGKNFNRELDLSNPLDNAEAHNSAFNGVIGIGIFAQGIKTLAYMVRASVKKGLPKLKLKTAITLNGVTYDSFKDELSLWENLDAFLNAAIDNIKEQVLHVFNLNQDTIPAFIAGISMGINLETLTNLFTQDVIKTILQTKGYKNNPAHELIIEKIKSKLNITSVKSKVDNKKALEEEVKPAVVEELNGVSVADALSKEDNKATIESLNDSNMIDALKQDFSIDILLKKGELTEAETEWLFTQLQIAEVFSKFYTIGNKLSTVAKYLNIIRSLPVLKEQLDDLRDIEAEMFAENVDGTIDFKTPNKNFLIDLTNLFEENEHLQAAKETKDYFNSLLEKHVYKHRPAIYKFVETVFNSAILTLKLDKGNKDKSLKRDEIIRYLINSVKWDSEFVGYENSPEYVTEEGEIFRGQKAFSAHFIDKIEALKNKTLEDRNEAVKNGQEMGENLFLKSLSIEYNKNKGYWVRFTAGSNLKATDIYQLQEDFEALSKYDAKYNEETKTYDIVNVDSIGYSSLQKDFVRYAILQYGLKFGVMNYSLVLPSEIYKDFFTAMDSQLDKDTKDETLLHNIEEHFVLQAALNNASMVYEYRQTPIVVTQDEDGQNKTYEGVANGYAFDISFKAPDHAPLIIKRASRGKGKYGVTTHTLYVRLNEESSDIVYYRRLGNENPVDIYNSSDSARKGEYSIKKAFRPDLKLYSVQKIGDPLTSIAKLAVGDIIQLHECDDLINERAVVVEITGIVDGKASYKIVASGEPIMINEDVKKKANRAYLEKVLNKLSKRFGIKWVENNAIRQLGQFKNGKVLVNFNRADFTTPWHEFAHPFVHAIKKSNPTLYNNFVKEVQKEGSILQEVLDLHNKKYPQDIKTIDDFDIIEEAIVETIGRLAARNINLYDNTPIALEKVAKRFIFAVSKILKNLFNTFISPEALLHDTTLQDIANIMVYGTGNIKLGEIDKSLTFNQEENTDKIVDVGEEWTIPKVVVVKDGVQVTEEADYYEHKVTKERVNRITSNENGMINAFTGNKPNDHSTIAEKKAKAIWDDKGLPKEKKLKIVDDRLEDRDEYVKRETSWFQAGLIKGKILHKSLEKAYNPQKADAINKEIEELYARIPHVPVGYYNWVERYATKILNNAGIYPGDDDTSDKVFSEVKVVNKILKFGGTVDMMVVHSDSTRSYLEFKTGRSFNSKFTNALLKYGDQEVEIIANARSRAKLQVMLYAVMTRMNNPEVRFRDLKVVWVPNKYQASRVDADASIEVDSYLNMIKQLLNDDKILADLGYTKEEIATLRKEIKANSTLFDASYYSHSSNKSLDEEIVNEKDTKVILKRKLNRLNEIYSRIAYEKALPEQDKRDDSRFFKKDKAQGIDEGAEVQQLWKDIRALQADPEMDFTDSENKDIGFLEKWIGNYSDVKNKNVSVWKKIKDSAKREAELKSDMLRFRFKSLLDPVLKEYEGTHPSLRMRREGRFSFNNYNANEIFAPFLKFVPVEGYASKRQELIQKTDEQYNDLTDSQKALLDYMNELMEYYLFDPESVYNKSITTINVNGVEKTVSSLDFMMLKQGSKAIKPYRGMFPKVHKSYDEMRWEAGKGNTFLGTFTKSYLKYYFKTQLTNFIEDTFEGGMENTHLPVKFMGSVRMENDQNYSVNLAEAFDRFIMYSEYKSQMDVVYAAGKAMLYDMEISSIKANDPDRYSNTLQMINSKLMSDILNQKRLPNDALVKQKIRIGKHLISIDKIVIMLLKWTSSTVMWAKPISGTMNGVHAKLLLTRDATKGSIGKRFGLDSVVDYTARDVAFADAAYFGTTKGKDNKPDSGYLYDAMMGNTRHNKLFLLSEHFKYLPDNFDFYRLPGKSLMKRNNLFSTSNLYLFHALPEEYISFTTMAAQLHHLKHPTLKNADGSAKSIYDCYEVVTDSNGQSKIVWTGGTRGYQRIGSGNATSLVELNELTAQEIAKMKKVYERVQGSYRKDESSMLEHYVLGRAVMQLKKYFPRILLNIVRGKVYETDLGYFKEVGEKKDGENIYEWIARANGSKWTAAAKGFAYLATFNFSKYKTMDPEEKMHFIDACITATTLFISYSLYITAFADTDEDDELKRVWKMYLIDNYSQQYNPIDLLRTTKSIAIPVSAAKSINFAMSGSKLFLASIDYSLGNEDKAFTNHGDLKGWVEFRKGIPYAASYYDFIRRMDKMKSVDDFFENHSTILR